MPRPLKSTAKRAAFLGRVSTDAQSKADRYGLETQRQAAYDYAKRSDMEVVADFADVVSGASESRPQFYELLARAHEFDVVIVSHVDRLARENELGFRHMRLIREAGLELHSAARGVIDDSLTSGLEVLISSEERKRIQQRTYAGLLAKAQKGLVPTNIQLYGYRDVPGTGRVITDPLEAEIVQRIFELAATGASYYEIARDLNTREDKRLRNGAKQWYPGHLTRIIRQSAYKGEYHWPENSRKGTRPVLIHIPSIVDADTWARAQRRKIGRRPRSDRPLVGHLRCGWCGSSMASTANPKGYLYRCNAKARYGSSACKMPVRYGPTLERVVDEAVRATLADPERVREILASAPLPEDPNAEARAALAEKDARWLEAFQVGAITAAKLGGYRNEIRAQLRALATPMQERTYPLEDYAEKARTLPLRELLEYVKATVVVTPEHLEITLGTAL
jgi:DNA invertase Pin-like site-specific DNA recombinase/uncharacterized protein YgfB (UPF0149 family)